MCKTVARQEALQIAIGQGSGGAGGRGQRVNSQQGHTGIAEHDPPFHHRRHQHPRAAQFDETRLR